MIKQKLKIKGKLTADIATNTERMSKNKKNEEEKERIKKEIIKRRISSCI